MELQDSRVAKESSGVNRIDGYQSITAFISAPTEKATDTDSKIGNNRKPLDKEGVYYVSLSTDAQVVYSSCLSSFVYVRNTYASC